MRFYADGSWVERTPVQAGNRLEYSIAADTLTLYLQGWKKTTRLVRGEMYCLKVSDERLPDACRMVPPKMHGDVMLWLLGFDSSRRYYDQETFERRIAALRAAGEVNEVERVDGNGYGCAMEICSDAPGGVRSLYAYIENRFNVSKELAQDILKAWRWKLPYPRPYTEKVLQSSLKFTKAELAEVAKNTRLY